MLSGVSFVGSSEGTRTGKQFEAVNPATGEALQPAFSSAELEDVDKAASLAAAAFPQFSAVDNEARAAFLRGIADGLAAVSDTLVERAHQETALPVARLQGEVARTANQLRLFAGVVEEGSWVGARVDTADAGRKPLPKPDIRSMLIALGPVAVFGASNFPLAFSVAGGDTASALAAGNPVVVKAHPAHPGTSELVAQVIREQVQRHGLHEGVFSMLFDAGIEIGKALVQHPHIKAVGFTGSLNAGRALMDLAAHRAEPIPCYTEMSSVNPVFILPSALAQGEKLAADLTASFTLGAGQFCTKPGLVFFPPEADATALRAALHSAVKALPPFTMLTSGIASHYREAIHERTETSGAVAIEAQAATGQEGASTHAVLLETDAKQFLADPLLSEEIFGPTTLLISAQTQDELLQAAECLQGHLTATILGSEEELLASQELVGLLQRKVGRVIFNSYPTGVEVCHAMVHGGPYPATSDGRTTSVGSQAIFRFARPVCYQNMPQAALPYALRDGNPLGIWRMVNGAFGRD